MKRSKFEKDIEKAISSLIAARVCVENYKHLNQFPITGLSVVQLL